MLKLYLLNQGYIPLSLYSYEIRCGLCAYYFRCALFYAMFDLFSK